MYNRTETSQRVARQYQGGEYEEEGEDEEGGRSAFKGLIRNK
jgi:hypothetical protein